MSDADSELVREEVFVVCTRTVVVHAERVSVTPAQVCISEELRVSFGVIRVRYQDQGAFGIESVKYRKHGKRFLVL